MYLIPAVFCFVLVVFESTERKETGKGTEEKQTWEGQKEEHICSCCW